MLDTLKQTSSQTEMLFRLGSCKNGPEFVAIYAVISFLHKICRLKTLFTCLDCEKVSPPASVPFVGASLPIRALPRSTLKPGLHIIILCFGVDRENKLPSFFFGYNQKCRVVRLTLDLPSQTCPTPAHLFIYPLYTS